MNLGEVFYSLGSCELSLSREGGNNDGSIKPAFYGSILTLVNLGLTSIYKEFKLKVVRKQIEMGLPNSSYNINGDKDVLEILEVFDAEGVTIPINTHVASTNKFMVDNANGFSVRKVSNHDLVLGSSVTGSHFVVEYKALHPKVVLPVAIPVEDVDLALIELELPEAYLDLLVYYVAYKLSTAKDLQGILAKTPFHVGNNYQQRYETELLKLRNQGYDVDSEIQDNRFAAKGFC